MDRHPVVAGQFYPDDPRELHRQVNQYMPQNTEASTRPTILAMLPHAGYVYSGGVAGETVARARLHETVILLGPNHTGQGAPIGLWPDGAWLFPGGRLAVDQTLAGALLASCPHIVADHASHMREHSLEVQLPFLHAKHADTRIVPITIADPREEVLEEVGLTLARNIMASEKPVSLVVSSDMSHYISATSAQKLDALAIAQIQALSPRGLYATVRRNRISMCGVLPMTVGLFAAGKLGARKASLVRYATSGDVNGEYDQVVGYAGILVQ